MAEVKRTTLEKPAKGKIVPKANPYASLSLPREKSKHVGDINEYAGVIIGEPGIGKTTLAMQEEGVFLLTWDPFQKSLEIFQRHVKEWPEFIAYLGLLESSAEKKTFPYKRVLVDGCDLMFRACQKWVCQKLHVEHPADEAWGKGWDMLTVTFTDAVDRLLRLPCGIWFIAHSRWKEVENRHGLKNEKLTARLTDRAEDIIVGKSDLMLNIRYDGKERVCTIRGSDEFSAKCRIDTQFFTTDKRQVTDIVVGSKGPAEAWRRLNLAFSNQQKYATLEEFRVLLKKGVNPYKQK